LAASHRAAPWTASSRLQVRGGGRARAGALACVRACVRAHPQPHSHPHTCTTQSITHSPQTVALAHEPPRAAQHCSVVRRPLFARRPTVWARGARRRRAVLDSRLLPCQGRSCLRGDHGGPRKRFVHLNLNFARPPRTFPLTHCNHEAGWQCVMGLNQVAMSAQFWDFGKGWGAWCDPVREGGCDPVRECVAEPCEPVREGCCGPEPLNPKLSHMTNDEILSWEAHRDKLVSWCVCVLTHTAPVGVAALSSCQAAADAPAHAGRCSERGGPMTKRLTGASTWTASRRWVGARPRTSSILGKVNNPPPRVAAMAGVAVTFLSPCSSPKTRCGSSSPCTSFAGENYSFCGMLVTRLLSSFRLPSIDKTLLGRSQMS
jgi:hypothetical protein